jgi:hypothetical protein
MGINLCVFYNPELVNRMPVRRGITVCSYRRFGGACCLHLHRSPRRVVLKYPEDASSMPLRNVLLCTYPSTRRHIYDYLNLQVVMPLRVSWIRCYVA